MCGYKVKLLSLVQVQAAKLGFAKTRRVLQHGLENRLKLTGRRADDAQHLRSRSLLLLELFLSPLPHALEEHQLSSDVPTVSRKRFLREIRRPLPGGQLHEPAFDR